jgi:hypothetical protein
MSPTVRYGEMVVEPGLGRRAVAGQQGEHLVADALLLLVFERHRALHFALDACVLLDHVDALAPRAQIERVQKGVVEILLELVPQRRNQARHGQRGINGASAELGHCDVPPSDFPVFRAQFDRIARIVPLLP